MTVHDYQTASFGMTRYMVKPEYEVMPIICTFHFVCYICMITHQKGNSVNYRLTFQSLTAPVFSIGSPQSSSAALINGMLYTFRSI